MYSDRMGPETLDRFVDRDGVFWQVARGELPRPPAADTLGWELLAIDPDAGTIQVAFTATDAFLNPAGTVQGGFLAAMLDETLGPALVASLPDGEFAPTLDLQVQFHRPARVGRLVGSGCVVRRARDIAFLVGELADSNGSRLATATATAIIRPLNRIGPS